jgi:hypothetical protein
MRTFYKPLARRTFLRSGAMSLMALPFLRQRALAAENPSRLIILTAMNGLVDSQRESAFQCTGDDSSLTLASQFSSLESVKKKVVAFKDLHNMTLASSKFVSAGHDPAIQSLLTTKVGGSSVDQFVAEKIGAQSPFRSLSLRLIDSVKSGFHGTGGSWLPGVQSPQAVLDSVFARLPMTPGASVDPQLLRSRNVLDFVRKQNSALHAELCGKERELLEAHLDAVERARKAVEEMPPMPAATSQCKKPAPGLGFDVAAPANMQAVRDAHIEIVAMAAACQLTRVVSFCLRPDGTGERYPFIAGVDPGAIFHDYAHDSSVQKTAINAFIVDTFCKLVLRLEQIPDGAGTTLLDNSVVMLVSDQRFGGEFAKHDTANLPVVLAGGAGGKLRGGRMLSYSGGESFHKLLTSLCRFSGVDVPAFGDASVSAGGLPRL